MKTSDQLQSEITRLSEIYSKAASQRFENYMNCLDDYSTGGISDRANSEHLSILKNLRDTLKIQESNGGKFVEDCKILVLVDLEGNEICDHIVDTRWGKAFCFENGNGVQFVSFPKKQSTLTNKGFSIVTKIVTIEIIYNGELSKSRLPIRNCKIIDVQDHVPVSLEEIKEYHYDNQSINYRFALITEQHC